MTLGAHPKRPFGNPDLKKYLLSIRWKAYVIDKILQNFKIQLFGFSQTFPKNSAYQNLSTN